METYSNAAYLWNEGFARTTTTDYTVNELNQYTETVENGGAPAALAYDKNGNLIAGGGNTYSYDPENRLTHVTMADPSYFWSGDVAFTYDPFGRLERRTVTPPASASYITTFLLDGEYQIAEYDQDAGTGALTLQRRYVYGPAACAAGGCTACLHPAHHPRQGLGNAFAGAKGLKGDPFVGSEGRGMYL